MKSLLALERVGLLVLALLVPLAFYPFAEDGYRLTQLFALALAVPALALYSIAACGRPFLPFQSLLVCCFFIWRLITHRVAGLWDTAWMAEQLLYLVLYFWAVSRLGNSARAQRFRFFLFVATAAACVYGIVQSLGADPLASMAGDPGFGHRAYASMGNPIFWAGFLVMVLPMALVELLDNKSKPRVRHWLLAGLFLVALLFTQTRGAWLGFAVSMLALCWRWKRHLAWPRLAVLTVLGLAALVLFNIPGPHNPQKFKSVQRLISAVSLKSDGAEGRFFMWRVAAQAVKQHPVLGNGAGGFTRTYLENQARLMARPEYKKEPYRYTHDAHNDWIQWTAESGLPALLMMLFIFWGTLKRCWRKADRQAMALGAGLLALGVNASFNFPMDIVPSATLAWVYLGWASAKPGNDCFKSEVSGLRVFAFILVVTPALIIAPRFLGSSFLNAGMNRSLSGDAVGAKSLLQKAGPLLKDERAYNRLGLDASRLGDSAAASENLMKAVSLNPALADSWSNLCLAEGRAARYSFARAACLKALHYNPASKQAKANLANVYVGLAVQAMDRGDKKQAHDNLRACLALVPDHRAGQALKARWLISSK